MKIAFDIDGTLTDYNKFIHDYAIKYFIKKYGMTIANSNRLEIEDICDMIEFFRNKYSCSDEKAKEYTNQATSKYWTDIRTVIRFFLLSRFRRGAAAFLKICIKNGHKVEIHTSRAKSTGTNIVGKACRMLTYMQFLINGIFLPYDSFCFYKNDQDKINGLKKSKPDIVFDDKPEILLCLNIAKIKTICINGLHNKMLVENNYLIKTDDYEAINISLNKILGMGGFELCNRIAKSDLFYNKLRPLIPLTLKCFNPIILNKQNIIKQESKGIVLAPNHMRTWDPLIVTCVIDKNIHWVALKRFFDGKDSIFNNNKNPVLRKITAYSFKRLEFFPIERLRDNPHANNVASIKDMNAFLKKKQYIGIFPEGTTRKPEGEDFGVFDKAFVHLAKRHDAYVQPISILWANKKKQVIVNFGEMFKVGDMSIDDAFNKYIEIQTLLLEENRKQLNQIGEKQ